MSKINNQSQLLSNLDFVQDITPETAANYSGGAVKVTDVTLTSKTSNRGISFNTNKAIEDLSDFGFDNATAFIAVNNSQTWRFYEDADFKGDFIEVGPDQARNAGDFGMEISSLKSVD